MTTGNDHRGIHTTMPMCRAVSKTDHRRRGRGTSQCSYLEEEGRVFNFFNIGDPYAYANLLGGEKVRVLYRDGQERHGHLNRTYQEVAYLKIGSDLEVHHVRLINFSNNQLIIDYEKRRGTVDDHVKKLMVQLVDRQGEVWIRRKKCKSGKQWGYMLAMYGDWVLVVFHDTHDYADGSGGLLSDSNGGSTHDINRALLGNLLQADHNSPIVIKPEDCAGKWVHMVDLIDINPDLQL